ncbi:MAG: peptide chain release factor N(5)-glutamine methyltransferase [Dehalococcoidia bacterium]
MAQALRSSAARLRSAGIDDADLEAEVLLRHATGLTREQLFARLQEPLARTSRAAFSKLLLRRLAHEPAAYITGHREFFGLDLACSPAALIPRQETELLVEVAVAWVMGHGSRVKAPRVVDVGTGNGAIAVALAVHLPQARVVAVDTSRGALQLARRNALAHGVARRIEFVQGSLLTALRGEFDLVVANLPYVPSRAYATLAPEVRDHEPEQALNAGRRGTSLIEALLASASGGLRPGGLLLAEHGWNQGRLLRDAASSAFPRARVETKRDLAGRERLLVVET